MELYIFIAGFFVSFMVVYGIFSLVPGEMRPTGEVPYRKAGEQKE